MPVTVTSNTLEELTRSIEELEKLTSQPTMTKRDEFRHAALLAKISLLKSGVSVSELREAERDRLLQQAGFARAPQQARTLLPREAEEEYRGFVRGAQVRATHVPSDVEVRANEGGSQAISFTTPSAGGTFVPQGFFDRLIGTMKLADQIFDDRYATVIETPTGAAMPCPIFDDASVSAVQVSETTQSVEADVFNFGSSTLNAFSFRSKVVAVSIELLQDAAFPWGAVLEKIFAGRIARGVGSALVNGSGNAAPTGLLTGVIAAGVSPSIANGSSENTGGSETGSTSIGTQDLNSLFGKLDPAYWPGAVWYLNPATAISLQGLTDRMGLPVASFRDGLSDQFNPTLYILGKPVALCPGMPTMGSGKNSVIVGHPDWFVTRRVPSASYIRRFSETASLVLNGLVGFEAWMRTDSNVQIPNVAQSAFQVLQNHS